MNFYVDADFAGLWVHGNPLEDISDKISTGFVVTSEIFFIMGFKDIDRGFSLYYTFWLCGIVSLC